MTVVQTAEDRRLEAWSDGRAYRIANEPPELPPLSDEHDPEPQRRTVLPRRAVDGATFILDAPTTIPALWGEGDQVAWAQGEALMLCGPSGVGKTTLAQQLLLARMGVLPPRLLGMPVQVDPRPQLYIAADRPDQARRSMARMVTEDDREILEQQLVVWKGPPPFNLAQEPEKLSIFVQEYGCGTVIVDSLKDLVPDLSKDESGGRYNQARQHCLAAGIDVVELHHQRKAGSDGGKPKHLADVYGSTWITAGAGSVFVLWGEPGDVIIELLHLKQPADQIGPHKVRHDHHAGTSELDAPVDLLALLRGSRRGMSARMAAVAMFEKQEPNRNEIEKARRRLESLVRARHAVKQPGSKGGSDGGESDLWFPVDDVHELIGEAS